MEETKTVETEVEETGKEESKDTETVNEVEETKQTDSAQTVETSKTFDKKYITEIEVKHKAELKSAVEEALKKASMSEEEKREFEKEEKIKDLEEREKQNLLRELKMDATELLSEQKLPKSFLDIVVKDNLETTKKNIEALKTTFDSAVQEQVEKRLVGKTPKNGSTVGSNTTDSLAQTFRNALNG